MQDIIKNINRSSKRNFDLISCGLASPQMIRSWSWGEVKNLKLLITEHLNLKEMVFSVHEFLVQSKILSVFVENIRDESIEVLFVRNVVLK